MIIKTVTLFFYCVVHELDKIHWVWRICVVVICP